MIKVASWNVNGIRACTKKGFVEWLDSNKFDFVFLQEIKAMEEQFPEELLEHKNYSMEIFSAEKKGYSGVALIYKNKFKGEIELLRGIGEDKFDCEGRLVGFKIGKSHIFGGYFPNGQRDHNRVPYKLEFSSLVAKTSLKLSKKHKGPVVICGDINTAHKEIDLKNPKSNQKSTGFLPIEREWMTDFLASGFTDCFRFKNGDVEEKYTWWTYRSGCREKNVGWRLDYFFITQGHSDLVKKCFHQDDVLGSDHCPVVLQLSDDFIK